MQPTAVPRPVVVLLAALLVAIAGAQTTGAETTDPQPADPDLAVLVAEHPVWGPALAYRAPATDAAERAFALAADEARHREAGLTTSVSFAPSLAWRGAPGAATLGPTWRTDVVAAVGYRFDAERIAQGHLDLHRAAVRRTERAHRDLRTALELHVDLQRAHLALGAAEDAASGRAATLADAEAAELGRDPSAAPSTTLAAARLAHERAVAAVERTAREVAAAARAARAAGFDPDVAEAVHRDRWAPLPLEGWRLWVPDVAPEAVPDVVGAEWAAAIAAAAVARAGVGGILDDLALDLAYVLPEARLRATFDLDEGRPGAAVDATLRPSARPSWSVTVGATLRIDDRTAAELAAARADLVVAQSALAAARAETPWALEAARRAALDAEADVAFAERALELGRMALREAVERHRAAGADANAEATGDAPGDAPRDATAEADARARAAAQERRDAELARAAVGFDRERDAFYRAWSAYALAVERYLVLAGSPGGVLAPP